MKAAVLHNFGETPCYEDFPDPIPSDEELLVHVSAVALENFDKGIASGMHYASRQLMPSVPAVLGTDGIGTLPDGRIVGFGGTRSPFGSMAELSVVPKTNIAPVPAGIEPKFAATVPSSALSALFR